MVDPQRRDTYFFVYGVDRYDADTTFAYAGDGGDPVAVSAHVEGLTRRTTYHLRLVAFSHHGFAAGGDQLHDGGRARSAPPPLAPARRPRRPPTASR